MTRKQIREHTFKALFQKEFCDLEEYRERCALYVEEMEELEPACREEIRQRALAVGERLEELDVRLNEVAEGWKTGRMGKVELTVLRIAAYEILFDKDIPEGVAINEAVEIAKKYGQETSGRFVNAILAKLIKTGDSDS